MKKTTLTIFFIITFPSLALGAESKILVATPKLGSGVYTIEVRVNTGDEEINAIEGQFIYDQNTLNLEKIITGQSVVGAWLKEPQDSKGKIKFSGIITSGYKGSNGEILSLYLSAKRAGETTVSFSGKVYLNDGEGTAEEINLNSEKFNTVILKEPELLSVLSKDITPPKIIQSEISQNEAMFNGQPFIIVFAKDEESGVAIYELALTETNFSPEEVLKNSEIYWQTFNSPALLSEGFADKYVYVRVKNKEDNTTAQLISTPRQLSPQSPISLLRKWWGLGIIILIIFGLIWGLRRFLSRHGSSYKTSN